MKKRLIMPELFRGQRREVVCSQPDNQHISRSNVVDLALVGSQSAIQRELFQFSLLVDDDCGLVLPVNLAISTTKLTARSLLNAFRAYMNHRRNVKAKKDVARDTHIVGEQTIGQLLGQNQGATNIEIEKTEIAGFKKILNKYGVDYAITKDCSMKLPRYLVFFKARDSDVLTAAFKEFSAETARKAERPSMLALLAKMKDLVASVPKKVHEKKQERDL